MNHKQTLDRIVAKYNSTDNAAYLLDDLLQLTAEVNKEVNEKNTPPVQIAAAAKNYLHRTLNRNEEDAISCGFPKFDKDLAGFLPGEFIIFGGRPGMGKTSLFMLSSSSCDIKGKNSDSSSIPVETIIVFSNESFI